jgi:hypothetical protein
MDEYTSNLEPDAGRSRKYCPRIGGQANIEIERARSAWQLIGATLALYRRYPWLFLALAAVVVVPFDVLELLIEVVKVLHGAIRTILSFALFVADFALVLPLISALHVHAVADVREGREPEIGPVARRGLASLPVLCRAAGAAYLGVMLGLIALIVPGVILALRWAVVAQVATLRAENWRGALEESELLTTRSYRHIFALLLILFVVTVLPGIVLNVIFGWHVAVTKWVLSAAIGVLLSSFNALAIGLLYYDLSARRRDEPRQAATAASGDGLNPGGAPGDPLTPLAYSDEKRPPGWYIDPENPGRMRYWLADGSGAWSKRKARTPNRTFDEWEKLRRPEPE